MLAPTSANGDQRKRLTKASLRHKIRNLRAKLKSLLSI
jgi:hypothetical protein